MALPDPNEVRYDLGKQVVSDPKTKQQRLIWTIVYNNGEVETREQGPDGEWQTVDVTVDQKYQALYKQEIADAKNQAATQDQWQSGSTTSKYLMRQGADGNVQTVENPNYVPPREPAGPAGRQLTSAEMQKQDLDVQKAQMEIEAARAKQRAQEQYMQLVGKGREDKQKQLAEQIRAGQINVADATKQMEAYDQMVAIQGGTSPYAIMKDEKTFAQTEKNNQTTLARNVAGDRMQTGATLSNALIGSIGGLYDKVYSSTNPAMVDPLAYGKLIMDEYGPPKQTSDWANMILRGALMPPDAQVDPFQMFNLVNKDRSNADRGSR